MNIFTVRELHIFLNLQSLYTQDVKEMLNEAGITGLRCGDFFLYTLFGFAVLFGLIV